MQPCQMIKQSAGSLVGSRWPHSSCEHFRQRMIVMGAAREAEASIAASCWARVLRRDLCVWVMDASSPARLFIANTYALGSL